MISFSRELNRHRLQAKVRSRAFCPASNYVRPFNHDMDASEKRQHSALALGLRPNLSSTGRRRRISTSDPSLLAGMLPIKVQARATQQAAGAVKCAAGV
eukprot:scaffold59766_cov21-Phaeocystis_antarctica.AAC.1